MVRCASREGTVAAATEDPGTLGVLLLCLLLGHVGQSIKGCTRGQREACQPRLHKSTSTQSASLPTPLPCRTPQPAQHPPPSSWPPPHRKAGHADTPQPTSTHLPALGLHPLHGHSLPLLLRSGRGGAALTARRSRGCCLAGGCLVLLLLLGGQLSAQALGNL